MLLAPEKDQSVWVACLFTSKGYGKNRDSEEKILENTKTAVLDLLHTVERTRAFGYTVGELRMCEINSGNFGVPWEKTLAVLEGIELREGWPDRIEVWRLDK